MSLNKIKVLIVDDSAFARKVIREVLEKDKDIEVLGYARDGLDAIEKIAELKPDVITLDLVMPDLDGIGVLKTLNRENSPKVILVTVSGSDSELAIEALNMGAIDIVTKPTALPTDKLYGLSDELITKIKTAYESVPKLYNVEDNILKSPITVPEKYTGTMKLMVLGTSTGGPQAITEIFRTLPENLPVPLVIALHIPAGYTAPLAERISKNSQLKMIEASDGLELVSGMAYIAPGGMNLKVQKQNEKVIALVSREPEESLYHPSVNILFESAADQFGGAVIGVVLTGMGDDGMLGSLAIKKAGGVVLAESSSSCVVYGMPRTVIESGASSDEASLEKMTKLMIKSLLN